MMKSFKRLLCLVSCILITGLTIIGCSNGFSDIDNNLNPETITLEDENSFARLIIPANSIPSDKQLTINPTNDSNLPDGYIGTVFDIGPDGTQFEKPATLILRYDPNNLPAGIVPEDLSIAVEVNGSWEELPTTHNPNNHTLSAEISHLCNYVIVFIFRNPPSNPANPSGISPEEILCIDNDNNVEPCGEDVLVVKDHINDFPGSEIYTFLYFDLSVYSNKTIITANLQLTKYDQDTYDLSSEVAAYPVTSNWDSLSTTVPTYSLSGIDSHTLPDGDCYDPPTTVSWDITNLVQDWVDGTTTNNGIGLIGEGFLMAFFRDPVLTINYSD